MLEEENLVRKLQIEKLTVMIYKQRQALGRAAGDAVAAKIKALQTTQSQINIVFAAAPSQNEFLAALRAEAGIDWK